MTSGVLIALCTAPPDVARGLATQLVTERLAACVNVVPAIESIYRWEGRVEAGNEALLVIKTTPAAVAPLKARLVALHPYTCPELVVFPVTDGLPAYLAWVMASTGGDGGDPRPGSAP